MTVTCRFYSVLFLKVILYGQIQSKHKVTFQTFRTQFPTFHIISYNSDIYVPVMHARRTAAVDKLMLDVEISTQNITT